MKRITRNNINIYYWYLGFFQLLVGPIITLYLLYKGLNFTMIMTLQSLFAVSVFLLEVPTGAISDIFGRKRSLVFSCVAMIIGIFIYILGHSFWVFALGEFTLALGMTLKSGSDTALIYDTLLENGREGEFTKIQGKGRSTMLGVQIVGSAIVGYLYTINEHLPLLLSALLMLIAGIIAMFFVETTIHKKSEKQKYFTLIKESGRFLLTHKKVRTIVIYFMFFMVFFRIGFWYYQPYFDALSIDVKYFGLIFAFFNIIATVFSRLSHKYIKWTKGYSLISLSIIMSLSFILTGITAFPIGILFIAIQQIARGVFNPVFMKYMNKHIESTKRATVISFSSLLNNAVIALVFPLIGYLMDIIDPVSMNLYTGIFMMIGTLFFFFFLKKKLV